MILAVDLGNTNITLGLFNQGAEELLHTMRVETVHSRTADEYAVLLTQLMLMRGVHPNSVEAAILASVVPQVTDVLVEAIRLAFTCDTLLIGPGTRTGMPVLYENPHDVGADRIVGAVAAYNRVKGPVIVVDVGTGTTFDCVSARGEYLGGVIAPGIQISLDALVARAAKLHPIELTVPSRVIARNTSHAIQSGVVFGYAGLVDGLVERIHEELGVVSKVIATGGLAALVAPHTRTLTEVDPHLTLRGLQILYERNRGSG